MKQNDARRAAIIAYRQPVDSKVTLTADEIVTVATDLANRTMDGDIGMARTDGNKPKFDDIKEMIKYWKSSVRDCLLKDTAVNGGTKHTAAFSRPRDEQLKNLTLLHTQYIENGDNESAVLIQAAIDERKKKLESEKPASQRKKEVNLDTIPEELKEQLGLVS